MGAKIELKFLGGVADHNNLTGSCYLLNVRSGKNSFSVAVDIGMWQGNYQDSNDRNNSLDLDCAKLDAVVLTHAHIDHIGRLPLLSRMGFSGRVFCTAQTAELAPIMMADTAKILESESKYRRLRDAKSKREQLRNRTKPERLQRKGEKILLKTKGSGRENGCGPLYRQEDVKKCVSLIKNGGCDYHEWIKIEKNIQLKFYPSGHVLGGAICIIRIFADKKRDPIYIGFSGDLGRKDGIILPPPATVQEPLDYWVTESTYGGIANPERAVEIQSMLEMVRTAHAKGSRILIPSFSLERTQEIVYLLSYHMKRGDVPGLDIYLDSPLAKKITSVFRRNWDSPMFKDQDMLDFNPFNISENPFLKTVESDADSVALTKKQGPYLVIAGSGMCEAGRIRNHLRENLPKKNTLLCLISFMAPDTLGRKLKDGFPIVRMNKEEISVKAKVVTFNSFSAHADGPFLVEYTKRVACGKSKNRLKHIFIVHGDIRNSFCLKSDLLESLGDNWSDRISIPRLNETIIL